MTEQINVKREGKSKFEPLANSKWRRMRSLSLIDGPNPFMSKREAKLLAYPARIVKNKRRKRHGR